MSGTARRAVAICGGLLVGFGLVQASESEGFYIVAGLGVGLLVAALVQD